MEYKENLETKEVEAELEAFYQRIKAENSYCFSKLSDKHVDYTALTREGVLVEGTIEDGYGVMLLVWGVRPSTVIRYLGSFVYSLTYDLGGFKSTFSKQKSGEATVLTKSWEPSGNLIKQWENDPCSRKSVEITWYSDGQLKAVERRLKGYLHGEQLVWDHGGTLVSLANYEKGNPDGLQQSWHANGTLESSFFAEQSYIRGAYRRWASDGTAILTGAVGYYWNKSRVF